MIAIALFIIGWLVPEMCLLIGGNATMRIPYFINFLMGAALAILGYFLVG